MKKTQTFLRTFYLLLLILLFSFTTAAYAANPQIISSPNGKIKVKIELKDKIYYQVEYENEVLLENCFLRMTLPDEVLGDNPRLKSSKQKFVSEVIRPQVPLKFSMVKNEYNNMLLTFREGFSVEFRVFDDGVAYRFITAKKGEMNVVNEDLVIHFPGNYLAHMQQPRGFKTAYEEVYTHVRTSGFVNEDRSMCVMPVLLSTDNKYKILVSESDLSDYPCMFLKGTSSNGMISTFPKVPLEVGYDGDRSVKITREANYIARTSGSRTFPWRYFVLSENDGQLIENTMTLKLSGKSRIADASWIVPGQVSWEWWNDAAPYGPDVNFVSGYNLETYKYYIDFASRYGIKYIIMDEGWAKSTTDPYTPNPAVDVHEIIRYGKEKNVGVVLWLTWLTVENNFDLFRVFSEWGVKGVKVDFMDRSDQWMVNYYERVAREAAKHKLFVDFHGSFKPAGLEYLYPNVLSYEGVRGMEQMGGCFPDNSLYFPFIRNAVGAMDYTPGAMFSMQPDAYAARRPNSGSIGTRAYQMALFILFESGLQMLADNPTLYYNNNECTEFITKVPVVWDETIALHAKAGQYAVVAKRNGEKWYIGAIMNGDEKEKIFELDLSFLNPDKSYKMTSFEDGINAGRQAMDYRKKQSVISGTEKISVKLVRNGGWAAVLE